jgi:hypothetical protein
MYTRKFLIRDPHVSLRVVYVALYKIVRFLINYSYVYM